MFELSTLTAVKELSEAPAEPEAGLDRACRVRRPPEGWCADVRRHTCSVPDRHVAQIYPNHQVPLRIELQHPAHVDHKLRHGLECASHSESGLIIHRIREPNHSRTDFRISAKSLSCNS